ncbi:hypothetical protein LTR22_010916 [Elasticomyces elasticus]|nr:hypothetical protein LTR22_010916 [Elasticomyces elasticus]KAK4919929.1 hypothetical protein LTR49_012527 [Elasticomyces elasticus]KAK5756690.1 hypothetical protein LTS12_013153 [Elasticomyces elasticus]
MLDPPWHQTFDWIFHPVDDINSDDIESGDADTDEDDLDDSDTGDTGIDGFDTNEMDIIADDIGADDIGADDIGADDIGADDIGADDIDTDNVEDCNSRPDFMQWLRNGSGLFWISGKLGSGKSTLMAHIIRNERTTTELQVWAKPRIPRVISFFFWRAGSHEQALQNSIAGLLRSLIFQLLDQIEGLTEKVVKRNDLQTCRMAPWHESSLRALLHDVIEAAEDERLCFFVDGLDEFRGDCNKLASEVCSIFQKYPHAKLCVSSRPEEPLVQRFAEFVRLRMEELNRRDIKQYVVAQLGSDSLERKNLTYEICRRANGVFLWAVVVTREVFLGLQNGEDPEILEQRIQQLNPEMDKLFGELLQNIDKLHKNTLAFFLNALSLTTDAEIDPPSVTLLAAALCKDRIISYTAFAQQCELRCRQINAYSKGLLQLDSSAGKSHEQVECVWLVPPEAFQDIQGMRGDDAAVALLAVKARRKAFLPSHSTGSTAEREVIRYLLSRVQWSHRSAYDFVAKQDAQAALGLDVSSARPGVLAKLLSGQVQLLAIAPSSISHDKLLSSLSRLKDIVDTIARACNSELGDMHGRLDQARNLVKHMEQDDLDGGLSVGAPGEREMFDPRCGIRAWHPQSSPEIRFWCCCATGDLIRYLSDRMLVLGSNDDRGLMVASVIASFTSGPRVAHPSFRYPFDIWNREYQLQDLGSTCLVSLLTILVGQRERSSGGKSEALLHASLFKRQSNVDIYCDITWFSNVKEEWCYDVDETVHGCGGQNA